jgi:hypothetical protein
VPTATRDDDEFQALGLSLREATGKFLELLPVSREIATRVAAIQAPGELADVVSTTKVVHGWASSPGSAG